MAQEAKQVQEKQPVQLKVSEVLEMLNQGMDRRAIAKKYGLTLATVKELFKHPKLKDKRVKPRTPVTLIDDTEAEGTAGSTEASGNTESSGGAEATKVAEPVAASAGATKGEW